MATRFAVLVSLLVFASNAAALDNNRKGFIFGMGLGPSATDYTVNATVIENGTPILQEVANDQSYGVGLDLRIGGGINEKIMVFYLSRIPWFENPVGRKNGSITAGISALAATYSFRPEPGGFYLLGGVGFASWSQGFPLTFPETWWGPGAIVGLGWEFKPHFPLEFTVQYGKPTGEEFGFETEAETVSVIATIGFLLY